MQLHIKGVSGELHSMLVTGNETVGDIKKKLEHLEEPVESFTTFDQIVNLLQLKGLADSLKNPYCVIAKRRNGTTCPIALSSEDTVATTHQKITEAEGIEPESLTFIASHDGHLHVHVYAKEESTEAQADSYSVYKRSTLPQPLLLVNVLLCRSPVLLSESSLC
ncbi:hypothetical protein BSKO_09942 [Bryopsis sp. KO-2023]|nr:hypothetical protein BSKO_09942 [Bryopsis sp. KO-2023]